MPGDQNEGAPHFPLPRVRDLPDRLRPPVETLHRPPTLSPAEHGPSLGSSRLEL
jgi:hypothetical protein